jgi:hypothetical protein
MRRGQNKAVGQPCPCGRKAVMWKSGWVCAKCLEIEAHHARREEIRKARQEHEYEPVANAYKAHVVHLN